MGIWEFGDLGIWGFGDLEIWEFEDLEIWEFEIGNLGVLIFLSKFISNFYSSLNDSENKGIISKSGDS